MSGMLMVTSEGERFLYRVAGIAAIDGRALVRQFEGERFWCLPGGRVEMGEGRRWRWRGRCERS
jgi:8-oxo-dGTP pyrophosphatase MutT (NUDIX family)